MKSDFIGIYCSDGRCALFKGEGYVERSFGMVYLYRKGDTRPGHEIKLNYVNFNRST